METLTVNPDACSPCNTTGRIVAAGGARNCRRCRGTGSLLGSLGIRGRLRNMTFDSYEPTCDEANDVLAVCQEFVQSPKGILILSGSVGTGKTHLGVSVVRSIGGRYMTLAEMVTEIQDCYGKGRSDLEKIRELGREKVLVLDEVGRQRHSEDAQYQIQRVLDERYIMETPTVLISNLFPDKFPGELGDYIADRLAEKCQVAKFGWGSWRRETS